MNKQETIKYLTDLMATVQMAHFKGRELGVRVHESGNDDAAISVDLYNFEGDGKPVCDGLNPCTITYDDGTTDKGLVYCMCYNPDEEETPLVFLFSHDEYGDGGDIDIDPEDLSEETLLNITQWLEKAMQPASSVPDGFLTSEASQGPSVDVGKATAIIALWSDWCMDWADENLWLDYMVRHPKGHCNRQHLQEKWDHCYEKYGNKAAMTMFWRELDNDNRAILTEYITTQWHNNENK